LLETAAGSPDRKNGGPYAESVTPGSAGFRPPRQKKHPASPVTLQGQVSGFRLQSLS